MFLIACVIGVCSVTVEAQNIVNPESKKMYSNRAIGYTVPTPYYGTPAMPVFLVPPEAPVRVQVAQTGVRAGVPAAKFVEAEILAPTAPLVPLVPITTHAPVAVEPSAPPTIKATAPLPPVFYSSVPKVDVFDELDALYARLAKIQLEKRQLDTALTLVKSIKSEIFRIRTLVDLAEYVSRDKSYQSEAEQLYSLALSGMEALGKKADAPPVAPVPEKSVVPEPAEPLQPQPLPENPSLLQDDRAKHNVIGKLPPPSPPRGNGVDGGVETFVSSL